MINRLANKLQPGSVKKIQKVNAPFVQMENISAFLEAARSMGLQTHELFQTVDLYEGTILLPSSLIIIIIIFTLNALGLLLCVFRLMTFFLSFFLSFFCFHVNSQEHVCCSYLVAGTEKNQTLNLFFCVCVNQRHGTCFMHIVE